MAQELITKLKEKLNQFLLEEKELKEKIEDSNIFNDQQKYTKIARKLGSLKKITSKYIKYLDIEKKLIELEELKDNELGELIEIEKEDLSDQKDQIEEDLIEHLILTDDLSARDAIIEIRAGTGGDEACLFVADLYKMYFKFAEVNKFSVEIMHLSSNDEGGYKEIIFKISGENVYQIFQYESGNHRVQRVPLTETQGRIHTSTCTVAVLPEADEIDIDLSPSSYRKDVFRAGGKGGQHVNKTESAVRLIHLETGIVATCQDEKSQHKNFERALRVLRARLFNHYRQLADNERDSNRRKQIGSGSRSEKIRTYNWPQNRITDHRIGKNYSLDIVIAGALKNLVEDLQNYDKQLKIEQL